MIELFVSFLFLLIHGGLCEEHRPHYIKPIDDGIHYGIINAFYPEWIRTFNDTHFKQHLPSPVNIWMRCVDKSIRGYFFVENLKDQLSHGKEADMPTAPLFNSLRILANDKNVPFKTWFGGGDFEFELDDTMNIAEPWNEQTIDIKIEGWRHYTRFPLNKCKPTPSVREFIDHKQHQIKAHHRKHEKEFDGVFDLNHGHKFQYIMHIHLRDFKDFNAANKRVVHGVAKHLAYHRCVLNLTSYELVIQEEHIPMYMEHPYIVKAAESGWLTFIIRNPYNPSPIEMWGPSNCYWQAYTQNLAILQHWKDPIDTRIYFWDSDEFMVFNNGYSRDQYFQLIESRPVVGVKRHMAFCSDCPENLKDTQSGQVYKSTDEQTFAYHKHTYHKMLLLDDPKLVIDPNRAGCFIIHWAGCGAETHITDPAKTVFIAHFENFYNNRYNKPKAEISAAPKISQLFMDTTAHCPKLFLNHN